MQGTVWGKPELRMEVNMKTFLFTSSTSSNSHKAIHIHQTLLVCCWRPLPNFKLCKKGKGAWPYLHGAKATIRCSLTKWYAIPIVLQLLSTIDPLWYVIEAEKLISSRHVAMATDNPGDHHAKFEIHLILGYCWFYESVRIKQFSIGLYCSWHISSGNVTW